MSLDLSKYGVTPVQPARTGGLDLSKYGVTQISAPQAQAPAKPEVKGGIVGEVLTGATQRFGKTIGESLAAPENAEQFSQSLASTTELQNKVKKTIAEKKKRGEDTTQLEAALAKSLKDTPKVEDFTGDVINKTAGQVVGEGVGTGLEALSGGLLSTGKKLVTSKVLSTAQKVRQGAGVGAAYGAVGGGANTMQQGGGVADTVKGAALGGVIGAGLGGGLGYAGAKAGQYLSTGAERAAGLVEKKTSRSNKLVGEILQGKPEDIARGKKVLLDPELSKVKSYKEGFDVLDKKVGDLSKKQDKVLDTNLSVKKLGNLNASVKVGEKTIKHNYVKDALAQLDDFYTKTNNQVGRAEIAQLRAKAMKNGLTSREINNIARLHGEKLNAFNASGELASGLTKQAAENTRKGLKDTVVEVFGSDASRKIDREIASTLRVRDLFQTMNEKVNTLQQRIQERSFGAKAGYLIGKVVNTLGMGSPKGIVEALIPRGQGFKVMNAIDLEKALQKNIQLLQELSDKSIPEATLIQKMEKFLKGLPGKTPEKLSQYSDSPALRPAQRTKTIKRIQPIQKSIPRLKKK